MKRKLMMIVGLVIVLLIGGAILMNMRQQQRMDREVNAILAAAKAAGEPTTPEEMRRFERKRSASGNSAAEFEEAFKVLRSIKLARTATRQDSAQFPPGEPIPQHVIEAYVALVETNSVFFERIGQITNRHEAVFPFIWEDGSSGLLRHLTKFSLAAHVVSARCYLSIETGDVRSAISDIQLLCQLSSALEFEPILVTQNIRMTINSMVRHSLNRLLSAYELSVMELQTIAQALERGVITEGIVTGLIGERAIALQDHDNPTAPARTISPAIGSSAWTHDRYVQIRAITDLIHAAKMQPPRNLEGVAAVEQWLARELEPPAFWVSRVWHRYQKRTALSAQFMPRVSSNIREGVNALAGDRVARAVAAVELYRLEKQRLPSTLSEIASFASAGDLIDPFTGQQLIYKTNSIGSAYAIYSVGADRTDDGGPDLEPDQQNPTPSTKDIVFPVTLNRRTR